MNLEKLIERISQGEAVGQDELLPHLCAESVGDRTRVTVALAMAYREAGNLEQAKIFVERAWLLSGFSKDVLPLYTDINGALGDVPQIREAFKRRGILEAEKGNVGAALAYFNRWQYAYAEFKHIDKYEYDMDILCSVERMARPYRFIRRPVKSLPTGRKIRVAHLCYAAPVYLRILIDHAKYIDKERFELAFFTPESSSHIKYHASVKELIKELNDCGYKITALLDGGKSSLLPRLVALASQINNFKPDILVTDSILHTFEHFLAACLCNAPVTVGLLYASLPQSVAPSLDWAISATKHPLIDCPSNCSHVNIERILPTADKVAGYSKDILNIPDNAFVIMSVGRYLKFQTPQFWSAVVDVMREFPEMYYIIVGLDKKPPFLDHLLTPNLKQRVKLLGFRDDYLKLLCLADILVDTYPFGGGLVIMDAMAMGIPVVSFRNNYMKLFDQTDWSLAEELIGINDLVVERGDFEGFKHLLTELVRNDDYRQRLSSLCKDKIIKTHGKPERMVKKCEEIYLNVLEMKLRNDWATLESAPEASANSIRRFRYLISFPFLYALSHAKYIAWRIKLFLKREK